MKKLFRHFPNGTVCGVVTKDRIMLTYARKGKKDAFCKAKGRMVAGGRMDLLIANKQYNRKFNFIEIPLNYSDNTGVKVFHTIANHLSEIDFKESNMRMLEIKASSKQIEESYEKNIPAVVAIRQKG